MKLVQEEFTKKKDKSKITTVILILIFIIILVIIGILAAITQIKNAVLTIAVDGVYQPDLVEEFLFENGKTYIKIRGIAEYLGYESYNGEYNNKSENPSKCYIQNENEIVNFSLASKKIYKLDLEKELNYEYYYIDEDIMARGGALYTTVDGLQKAFNVSYIYDQSTNTINIYTLPYLISLYSSNVLDNNYIEMSQEFNDQKAILQSMLIVKRNNYGVINIQTGETIIEPKYDKISFIPTIGDFLVSSNNKMGIISKDKSMRIQLIYDSIELIDSDEGLYLVKKDNKYGVIDSRGNVKIYIEYDKIGIDAQKFTQNNIKNGYIIANNLIPVCKDDLWGMYDKTGKLVVDLEYTNFGYTANTNKDAMNLLVIPNYDVIVAEKSGKYLLLNSYGEKVLPVLVDDIYMTMESGEYKYYILANDRPRDAEKYLDNQGIVAKDENGIVLNDATRNDNNTQKSKSNQTDENNSSEEPPQEDIQEPEENIQETEDDNDSMESTEDSEE